jgi:23S rRNA pseudouridine2605 synthase
MKERLQKLIAQAGIASRRAAEELILAGEVSVNGDTVRELGVKADPASDHIKVRGRLINPKLEKRENVYLLLNKPKGYLSSVSDPEGRPLVTDLVRGAGRVHPVGRLDFNSEGLLILTNDGDFTNRISSSKRIPKVYQVKVKGEPNQAAINKLRRGVRLDDGFRTAPAEIKQLPSKSTNAWYEVTLHEGHNQQIRRMFDSIGHSVVKLRRVAIGHLRDDRLPVGRSRKLTLAEVAGFSGTVPARPPRPKPKSK